MDDNNQVLITNDSDEETNGEIQIPTQRRHRSDSTASNQTEEPKQQKKTTKKTIEDVMGCFTKTDEGLKCNLCINSRKVRLISSLLLALLDGQKSACLAKSLLSLLPFFSLKEIFC
jgi:hypothetical protein